MSDRASLDGIFHNTNYAPFAPAYPSQHSLFLSKVQAELAAGNTVRTVTVQFGANDLSNAAEAPGFLNLTAAQQQAVILQALGLIQQNYVNLLGELRALLPTADLYTIGYHNPYGGLPNHPFYTLAAPALQGLNQVIAGVGTNPAFGGHYVDFYTPVVGREAELTLINLFPNDLINYVHLNPAGYAVESQQLVGTASAAVPAPGGFVLMGIAVAGVFARARRRAA